MGQLVTKISEREPEKFPSQPILKPKGQYEVRQSSTLGMPSGHSQPLRIKDK